MRVTLSPVGDFDPLLFVGLSLILIFLGMVLTDQTWYIGSIDQKGQSKSPAGE